MGFSYQEAMEMPESEAMAYIDTYASINSPKGRSFQGDSNKIETNKTYRVLRNNK